TDTTHTTRTAQTPTAEAPQAHTPTVREVPDDTAARTGAEVTALDHLRLSPAPHLAQDMAAASAARGREVDLCELLYADRLGLRARRHTGTGRARKDVCGGRRARRLGWITAD